MAEDKLTAHRKFPWMEDNDTTGYIVVLLKTGQTLTINHDEDPSWERVTALYHATQFTKLALETTVANWLGRQTGKNGPPEIQVLEVSVSMRVARVVSLLED